MYLVIVRFVISTTNQNLIIIIKSSREVIKILCGPRPQAPGNETKLNETLTK